MAPKKGAGSKTSQSKKPINSVPDSDHIVFSNGPDDKKQQQKGKNSKEVEGPPRPDTKKIIGGASWSMYESFASESQDSIPTHVFRPRANLDDKKPKWNKPDYPSKQVPSESGDGEKLFRSWVILSKTDPKTREVTRLPAIQLPPEHAHMADSPTALEARHFAATYALYRISSMKNISMILPPKYRDLWKGEFQRLKEEDVKEDRGWKYDADPFAADVKRQEIKAAIEKRRLEQASRPPKVESLTLVQPGGSKTPTKAWDFVPKIELGENIRTRMETIIRSRSMWNQNNMQMAAAEKSAVLADLTKSGFQARHVEEAIGYCGTRREVLEWLLIHVPEDSLPSWSFPPGYSAGVSLASSDLAMDGKIKRMVQAGYSSQLCIQALRDNKGDESLALEGLQLRLVPPRKGDLSGIPQDHDIWEEEMTTLKAILDDRFTIHSSEHCSIRSDESSTSVKVVYHFRRPSSGYPQSSAPVFSVEAPTLPGYIRLSILKQCVQHAQEQLLGDQMIFNLLEWLETSTSAIIQDPGRLADLEILSPSLSASIPAATSTNASQERFLPTRSLERGYRRDIRTNAAILDAWRARQKTDAQVKMNAARQKLPAWSKQESITTTISQHQVTLVTGETGSGKSTQAIQYVLDEAIQAMRGSSTNMLCTQPRRVAALSLSERVSAERCSVEGNEVGYNIRGASKVSQNTKITFMTTGVLLRRLQGSTTIKSALANISHVFVDEVHERSLDTDFLLALLRDALPQLPDLKVVLMSATLDADVFADYFGGDRMVGRVHIEGRTYPVQDLYLDDVVRITQGATNTSRRLDAADGNNNNNNSNDEDVAAVGKAIQALGSGINYDLITSLVQHISAELDTSPSSSSGGGILIFLPGVLEIERCLRAVNKIPSVHVLPLHASLTPGEQRLVFRSAPAGKRKVVVSTNVAETSITIEDIVAVIDTGKVKETSYDAASNVVRLQEVWASRAACKQRRGRAGRVRAGKCYKLFTRNVETGVMAAAPAPEMQRTPLEQLCLSVKATGADREVGAFLAGTISPPDGQAVATAMKTLERIGALENGQLTGLGIYLSMIPADLRCAKLIIYGVLFDCVEPCLTIAAILSTKNPFVSPQDKREEAKEARSSFSTVDGDLLLASAAFDQWKQQQVSRTRHHRDILNWCSTRFLSLQTLRDIDSTRRQLLDSLIEAGLLPSSYNYTSEDDKNDASTRAHNRYSGNTMLLRGVIAGALNPQIARIQMPDKKYIASMSGAKELDPEAKTIKYFNEDNGRVFVHPSSVLFDAQSFSGAATFVSYFTKMATSKTFLRDLTPLNAYALLLFGGKIEVDTSGLGVVVDGWVKLKGWARIGVLVSRLRILLDDELKRRVDSSTSSAECDSDGTVFDVVRHLVELNGQDK